MSDGLQIGLLVLVSIVVIGQAIAIVLQSRAIREHAKSDAELVSKMSDQVIANSDYQIERMRIGAGAEVAKEYTRTVVAPASNASGTYPPEPPDFVTEANR